MTRDQILAIDQGTTSSRAVVYDLTLRPIAQAQREVLPRYPAPGWVEHDPGEILESIRGVVGEVLGSSGVSAQRLAAIGITNQRETCVMWDRSTGEALGPAIVWQDRRTTAFCERHRDRASWLRERTGLVLDPYFSATKLAWMLDRREEIQRAVGEGRIAAGTIDSFLVWHLTGGTEHLTDVTNASRTLLMDLRTGTWSPELLEFFAIPGGILPRIVPSSGVAATTGRFGALPEGLPISGIAGDQQASLMGQGCVESGQAKCTYGTGAFLLVHTGSRLVPSSQGLLTTAAASLGNQPPQYALEGSIFIAGAAVQWFRDGLKAVGAAPEIDQLCLEARADSELIFVPALTGLGAPHWQPDVRGTILGIHRGTTVADLARATLEGVAYQVADLIDAIHADLREPLRELRVDGGMARSAPFLQFQADLLGVTLVRSGQLESTALGAAVLAGLAVDCWPTREAALHLLREQGERFEAQQDAAWRAQALERWARAIDAVKRYY